ncbi:hypothetical protein O6H91_20G055600 [Diphasiastrum complanatum]|uniref:Uncharacterized protein n=1 Tax=Diphasiastrum complanatum TaxID=34168 RepID=A0ACC2AQN5_DIPCM|nr:hypothetical protein O6H91_20G055600 [Diphasiastrum complanatum]
MTERRLGVAIDFSATSKLALQWTLNNLARSGDYLLVITVVSDYNEIAEAQLWEESGSPLIPLSELGDAHLMKKYGVTFDSEVLSLLELAAEEKQLIVVAKAYYGDARDKLCDAAANIPLDCLILGSRGSGTLKRILLGSVSNYVVSHATCPVTIVNVPQNVAPSSHKV